MSDEAVTVEPFVHDGVEYMKDDAGILYDAEGIVVGEVSAENVVTMHPVEALAADSKEVDDFEHKGVSYLKDGDGILYNAKGIKVGVIHPEDGVIMHADKIDILHTGGTFDTESVTSLAALCGLVRKEPPTDTVDSRSFTKLFSPPLSTEICDTLFTAFDEDEDGMIDLSQAQGKPSAKLGGALKRYRAVMDTLESMDQESMQALRRSGKRSSAARSAVKGLALLLEEKPANENEDWWLFSNREILGDSNLVSRLSRFEKDEVQPGTIADVSACIEWIDAGEDLGLDELEKASEAVTGIYSWTVAVIEYGRVLRTVSPQLEVLDTAIAELEKINAEAAELRAKETRKERSEAAMAAAITGRNRRSKQLEQQRKKRDATDAAVAEPGALTDCVMKEYERDQLVVRQTELGHALDVEDASVWRVLSTKPVPVRSGIEPTTAQIEMLDTEMVFQGLEVRQSREGKQCVRSAEGWVSVLSKSGTVVLLENVVGAFEAREAERQRVVDEKEAEVRREREELARIKREERAGLDEGILSFCLPYSRLYVESL
jgi:hypothetical protein